MSKRVWCKIFGHIPDNTHSYVAFCRFCKQPIRKNYYVDFNKFFNKNVPNPVSINWETCELTLVKNDDSK